MAYLLLFVGPTRTASTSLFHWQISPLSLCLEPCNVRVSITKPFAEEHYYFDPKYKSGSFCIGDYISKFRDRSADVFIDYAPTVFHSPFIFEELIPFLSGSFERVHLICTVRDSASLANSCFKYNLRAQHPSFSSSRISDIENYTHKIAAYFDFFGFNDKIGKIVACHDNTDLSYVPFSALVSNPNSTSLPFIENLFDYGLKSNAFLYSQTNVVHNSSNTRFVLQKYFKYLSPVKPFLVPLFSRIRKYIPTVPVDLSDRQNSSLLVFKDCFSRNYPELTESQILKKLFAP